MSLEQFIWFEKYRPRNLNDMSIDPAYKKAFEHYITEKNIPHLLLEGIQGSGQKVKGNIDEQRPGQLKQRPGLGRSVGHRVPGT